MWPFKKKYHYSTPALTIVADNEPQKVMELARALYMEHNFPEGGRGYPPGFPDEMWRSARQDVIVSYVRAAKRGRPWVEES